jgi:hypothetical protein
MADPYVVLDHRSRIDDSAIANPTRGIQNGPSHHNYSLA